MNAPAPRNEREKGKIRKTTESFRIEPELKKQVAAHIADVGLDKSSVFRALAISTLDMNKDELWELVKQYG